MALKLGLNLGYWGIGPAGDDALEVVLAAEAAGFESVWAAESYGSDVVSVLAWLAPQTTTIKLGAAIMQVPARPPAAAWLPPLPLSRHPFSRQSSAGSPQCLQRSPPFSLPLQEVPVADLTAVTL